MSAPRTLLSMVGFPATPAPLNEAVLLFIDCQMEYVAGGLPLPGVKEALQEGAKLAALARANGVPVVHVVHHGRGLFDPKGEMAAIAPEVAPLDGEAVVIKAAPNSFAGTNLHEVLQATGRTKLIVAGFMTHMCVSTTVRAAIDLGYMSTVVANACATRDLPDGAGGVVTAAELHRAELAALSDRFAIIVPDASALERPRL
jgi:nicotinamidase-related amidase